MITNLSSRQSDNVYDPGRTVIYLMLVDSSFLAQFFGASPVSGYQRFDSRRRVSEKLISFAQRFYGQEATLTHRKQTCLGKKCVALEKKEDLDSAL